jgi:uncharacterized protein (TIGR02594 family)
MNISAFDLAQRYIGVKEIMGEDDHPLISWWFSLCGGWWGLDTGDETPWCSAFANGMAWELRLPRSKSARARSWLQVGKPIQKVRPPFEQDWPEATPGFDVVILKRGGINQPGPDVIDAPGHVGFYAGQNNNHILVLGGNQKDAVNISQYPKDRVLGVRRLHEPIKT